MQECHHEFFGHTQISAGQQANLEALHGMTNMLGLMERAFAGFDKLVELNLQLISSSLSGSSYCAKMMLAVNRPQDVFEMQIGLLQLASGQALLYRRDLFEMPSNSRL
nr:TIGR01841 family phasin [Cupriavidus sp. SK-3]